MLADSSAECFQTGPYNLDSPPLTTYNQQLWLTCVMQAENSNSKLQTLQITDVCQFNAQRGVRLFLNCVMNALGRLTTCSWCLRQWETFSSRSRSTLS